MKLIDINIINFKNISKANYSLAQLNEFYGKNATGKTAVLQAVQFCLVGTKADTTKIKSGEKFMSVEMNMIIQNTPVNIKTTLKDKGQVSCVLKVNSIKNTNPRTFIRKYVSSINFNPLLMLEKKDRFKRLLNLIPIQLGEEDLKIPGTEELFPISNPLLVDYSKHGIEVLNALDNDLRNARQSLGQTKTLYKKALEDKNNTLVATSNTYLKNYEKEVDLSLSLESVIERITKLTMDNANEITERKNLEQSIKDLNHKCTELKSTILNIGENEKSLMEQIKTLQNRRDSMLDDEIQYKKELADKINKIDGLTINIGVLSKNLTKYESDKADLFKMKNEANDVNNIKLQKKSILLKEEELKEAVDIWAVYEELVKVHFPALTNKILEPITKKIEGLTIDKNVIYYNNVSLDELSTSELLALSLQFLSLNDQDTNIVLIDKLETLDQESINKLKLKQFVVMAARVSDSRIDSDNWNSIKKEKKIDKSNIK